MSKIELSLDQSRHRRVYLVDGAPELEANIVLARGAPRAFVPSMIELDIVDDDMVTAWLFADLHGKRTRSRAARAQFSNHNPNVPPLTVAPEWVRELIEQAVPNWKGVDSG